MESTKANFENEILKEITNYSDELVSWRRDLHRIPELENNLPKTTEYVKSILTNLGIPYKILMNGNAIVGLIDSGIEGNVIGLRADMDALPIKEETNLSFASENGNMHACGHDGHTSALLGAAKYLNEHKDKFKGQVKLLFQPGEESPGGAKPMILEGALENPKVNAVLGMHNGHITDEIPHGHVGITFGAIMASVDVFTARIYGKGAHGAYPEQGHDPIIMSAEVISAFQSIVSRNIRPTESAVLSVCMIHGGTKDNIIPDFVEIQGTVRAFSKETQDIIEKRMHDILDSITKMHNGSYELNYLRKYPATINDEFFTYAFRESLRKILPEDRIVILKNPVMGAEDMSFFLEEVPGTFFFFNNPKEIQGKIWPLHNSKFDLDENLIPLAAALLAQGAIDYLNGEHSK